MKRYYLFILATVAALLTVAQDSAFTAIDSLLGAPVEQIAIDEEPVMETVTQSSTSPIAVIGLLLAVLAVVAAVLLYLRANRAEAKLAETRSSLNDLIEHHNKTSEILAQSLKELDDKISTVGKQIESQALKEATPPAKPAEFTPQTLYLSSADGRGVFATASTVADVANSVFVLTTGSPTTGTFAVIDNADVQRLALMLPSQSLATACDGDGIHNSNGKTRITTLKPGTAQWRDGAWHVIHKATIQYEP